MKGTTEAYICDICDRPTLNKHDIYKCVVCGRDVCKSIDCSYEIIVKVSMTIPNGIPFPHTKTEYRVCDECDYLSKEVVDLAIPRKHGKLYRAGSNGERDWVFVNERE